jgi:hypothetical protein
MFRVAGCISKTCHKLAHRLTLIVKHLQRYSHVVYLLKKRRGFPMSLIGALPLTRMGTAIGPEPQSTVVSGQFLFTMRCLFVAVLISFVLVVYASAIELFRYNLTTPDGRKFQYIFDVSDPAFQSAGDALSREEIVNRAMGWMLSFHKGPDDGSIESVTLRQKPIPHWLVAVADTTDGRIEHLLFAVVLPNGYVVVPTVSEQL